MSTLGLYLQVPFCRSKCSFCNFSSGVFSSALWEPYTEALSREIESICGFLPDHSLAERAIDSVYLGGGTPTLLGAQRMGRLFDSLGKTFRLQADSEVTSEVTPEITMEATPGSVEDRDWTRYIQGGVNRLSIGAQTMDSNELRSVGRLHDAEETCRMVRRARAAGIHNVSLDLIGGLPGQSRDSWGRSLDQTLELRPEHVSLYLFEVDEKSRLGREVLSGGARYRAAQMPEEEFFVESYFEGKRRLEQAGYEHYEISNFALPGFRSRHNLKYWRREPYLGFGAGSHSFDGIVRWENEGDVRTYIEKILQGESPQTARRKVPPREAEEEYLFLGLRQLQGVSLRDLRNRLGADLDPARRFSEPLERLAGWGLLRREGDRVRLTDRALLISNEVFQEFLG